jgi:hypothetical protein
MTKIKFFRQERYDGGTRAGIGVNDEAVWEAFEPGPEEVDPALLWYVDVVFEGARLPATPEGARVWLMNHEESIRQGFQLAADRLQLGMDQDESWPFRSQLAGLPRGVRGSLSVSAIRGLEEGELSEKLTETSRQWNSILERLVPLVRV